MDSENYLVKTGQKQVVQTVTVKMDWYQCLIFKLWIQKFGPGPWYGREISTCQIEMQNISLEENWSTGSETLLKEKKKFSKDQMQTYT